MKKSKKFRVAKEGATTDGRKISREWIEQMAKNYNPKTFGARVNLEHFKGIFPDGPFRAYGDVLSLSTENDNGTLYLVAEISPTDDLVELNKKRQKVYTSIEVNPSFADTGEAYLVGLAVTDNPASLGTEYLEFSSKASVNPLAARKADKDNLFTETMEATLEFVEDEEKPTLADKIKTMFTGHKASVDTDIKAFRADVEKAIDLVVEQFTALQSDITDLKTLAGSSEALSQLQDDFNELKETLTKTPTSHTHRSKATGNEGLVDIDC